MKFTQPFFIFPGQFFLVFQITFSHFPAGLVFRIKGFIGGTLIGFTGNLEK
ncbi:MAG: hypothetical protein H0V01_08680 [Bacteroidetes bacterium]|nr:hypothetical protein [Bacteroidota bacterium]HET6244564.1 hypothetical protein [Bacteroidia bacterium]